MASMDRASCNEVNCIGPAYVHPIKGKSSGSGFRRSLSQKPLALRMPSSDDVKRKSMRFALRRIVVMVTGFRSTSTSFWVSASGTDDGPCGKATCSAPTGNANPMSKNINGLLPCLYDSVGDNPANSSTPDGLATKYRFLIPPCSISANNSSFRNKTMRTVVASAPFFGFWNVNPIAPKHFRSAHGAAHRSSANASNP